MTGDWQGYVATAATAIGGTLALAKLIKIMRFREAHKREGLMDHHKIFPNGDREEFIDEINALKTKVRSDRAEISAIKRSQERHYDILVRICEHLRIEL